MNLFSFRSAYSRQSSGFAPRLAVALCFSTALTAGALIAPAFAQPAREAPAAVKDAKETAKDARDAAKDAKDAAKDARAEAREKRDAAKEAVQQKREAGDKEDTRERPGRGREERARGAEQKPATERQDRKPADAQPSKPAVKTEAADKPADKPAAQSGAKPQDKPQSAPQAKPQSAPDGDSRSRRGDTTSDRASDKPAAKTDTPAAKADSSEAPSRRTGDQPAGRSDEMRKPGDRDASQERGRDRDRDGDRAGGRDRDRDRGERDRARDDRGEAGDRDARRGSGPDAIRDVRSQRRERTEGGRTIIVEPDRREITRDGDRLIIRHDEAERFRRLDRDARVERGPGGVTRTIVTRPNGVRIITVTDERGRLVRRIRRESNGREIVIIDNRRSDRGPQRGFIEIAPPRITMPRARYILETDRARPEDVLEVLRAPPVQAVERAYTLEEIRQTPNLRARMPRVDLDTITFDTGSWEIERAQARMLQAVADGMKNIIARNPDEVFLIEGHTDAVGSDIDNLSLSDRRAESVALTLSEEFGVPPENLTTQGFGEEQLKVQTESAERANRRVTVRRITPLLQGQRTR